MKIVQIHGSNFLVDPNDRAAGRHSHFCTAEWHANISHTQSVYESTTIFISFHILFIQCMSNVRSAHCMADLFFFCVYFERKWWDAEIWRKKRSLR